MRFDIPSVVRSKARVAGATEWLDTVDDLVTALEDEWSFESGSVFSDATEVLVIGATLDDWTEAVLKVHIPRPGEHAVHEINVDLQPVGRQMLAKAEGLARES